jgi:hypothetical protein
MGGKVLKQNEREDRKQKKKINISGVPTCNVINPSKPSCYSRYVS